MELSWRSLHSLIRFCAARTIVLVALLIPLEGATADCVIRDLNAALNLDLDACRPEPITVAEKVEALKSLPPDGAVTQLGGSELRKLQSLGAILRAHRRTDVYELRVIAVPQAWTGLYKRAVLLISLPALTLLNAEELQALSAHEIGHEYVWQQFAAAKAHDDARQLRELELICDAISLATLARLGIRPERLQSATEKLFWYNRERLGVPLNERNYPSLTERRHLVETMTRTRLHRFTPEGQSVRGR